MPRSSVIAWRGPSLFTGEPIQVVLTGIETPSSNEKTGPMVQASIIRADGHAGHDVGTERERAVCGTCPLRGPKKTRICYVAWGVWLVGQHSHRYPAVHEIEAAVMLAGKSLRLGSYGDPAAVPTEVWLTLLSRVRSWTGYTHAWRTCDPRLRHLVMASVEDREGYLEANRRGWRTFRVKHASMDTYPSEIYCPSNKVQCIACRLCSGKSTLAKNVAIDVHGKAGEAHFLRIVQTRLAV